MQGEFDLTFFQDGLLAPVFLVGLLVASPIFAEVHLVAVTIRVVVCIKVPTYLLFVPSYV